MNLYHTDIGSGPPLVFIHGYPLNGTIWKAQEKLADQFRIILPDLPGFGRTPASSDLSIDEYADAIVAFLDDLRIDHATIFGHSMGGYILLSLADRYPDRLEAMGLVCSQAGGDTPEIRESRLKTAERVAREGSSIVVETMVDKLLAPSNEHFKPILRSLMETTSPESIGVALRAMAARTDRFHVFSQLHFPVLIVSGKQDVLIPEEKARLMSDRLKIGKWVTLDDCGHMPMMEQPDRLNAEIRTFMNLVS